MWGCLKTGDPQDGGFPFGFLFTATPKGDPPKTSHPLRFGDPWFSAKKSLCTWIGTEAVSQPICFRATCMVVKAQGIVG